MKYTYKEPKIRNYNKLEFWCGNNRVGFIQNLDVDWNISGKHVAKFSRMTTYNNTVLENYGFNKFKIVVKIQRVEIQESVEEELVECWGMCPANTKKKVLEDYDIIYGVKFSDDFKWDNIKVFVHNDEHHYEGAFKLNVLSKDVMDNMCKKPKEENIYFVIN